MPCVVTLGDRIASLPLSIPTLCTALHRRRRPLIFANMNPSASSLSSAVGKPASPTSPDFSHNRCLAPSRSPRAMPSHLTYATTRVPLRRQVFLPTAPHRPSPPTLDVTRTCCLAFLPLVSSAAPPWRPGPPRPLLTIIEGLSRLRPDLLTTAESASRVFHEVLVVSSFRSAVRPTLGRPGWSLEETALPNVEYEVAILLFISSKFPATPKDIY